MVRGGGSAFSHPIYKALVVAISFSRGGTRVQSRAKAFPTANHRSFDTAYILRFAISRSMNPSAHVVLTQSQITSTCMLGTHEIELLKEGGHWSGCPPHGPVYSPYSFVTAHAGLRGLNCNRVTKR